MKLKLIVGLGNPGKEYERTYHNVGLAFIEFLKEHPLDMPGVPAPLVRTSDTFMNTSGSFVLRAARERGAPPSETLVVHDDSDLPLGSFKLTEDDGAAGHHGVESVIEALGTKKFPRLRIGIRPEEKPGVPRLKAGDFVLKTLSRDERETLQETFAGAREAILNSISSA
jgi:PTH1 family peptidyl-tRNA hydrolase